MLELFRPKRRLFWKIFLWFWLSSALLIGGSGFVVRSLIIGPVLKPATDDQQLYIQTYVNEIQSNIDQYDIDSTAQLKQKLIDYSRDNFMPLIVLDRDSMSYTPPRPAIPDFSFLSELTRSPVPYFFTTLSAEVIGPIAYTANDMKVWLFFANPRPFSTLVEHLRFYPQMVLVVALLISGTLCYFLSLTITNPINQLRNLTQQLVNNSFHLPATKIKNGSDELGQLTEDVVGMVHTIDDFVRNNEQLVADISHDLQSPLARQRLALTLLEQGIDKSVPGDKLQTLVATAHKENYQLERMLKGLLAYNEINNLHKANIQSIALKPLLSSMLDDATFMQVNHHKQISLSMDGDITLNADPGLLYRAIDNVLQNACRYANKKISITVSERLNDTDDCAVITIEDDGPGVSQECRDKILQPFTRLEKARQNASDHVGLGLSICKRILDLHEGRINISDAKQSKTGLRISLVFPHKALVEETCLQT